MSPNSRKRRGRTAFGAKSGRDGRKSILTFIAIAARNFAAASPEIALGEDGVGLPVINVGAVGPLLRMPPRR